MTKQSIYNVLRTIRYIVYSIYFNFHYLPFKQAIRLPILLYKPHLHQLKGSIVIDTNKISTGMVKLGYPSSYLYPNNGIMYENGGGTIVIHGRMAIGNASAISIGPKGKLELFPYVGATASLKLVCYHRIVIGTNTLIGWDCIVMDTDLHSCTIVNDNHQKKRMTKGYDPVLIGEDVWIGNGALILKGSIINNKCIVASRTVYTKTSTTFPEYCLIAGTPPRVIKEGVFHNRFDDIINYQ